VVFRIAGRQVGNTTSFADGRFEAPLQVSTLEVGTYQVDADCGPLLFAPLDVVLVSAVNSDTSTFIIIIFFILIGMALFWRQRQQGHRRVP
jgi:hypothetical protein